MQGPSWIATFERIPAKLHDSLSLTLVTGAEIMMQSVLRLESDYAIIRGRMAGSTDAGRVIVLPYDQIVNLAFIKRMLAPEVEAIFGKTLEPADAVRPEAPAEAEAPVSEPAMPATEAAKSNPPTPAPAKPAAQPAAPASAANKGQAPPSKSILLARLRARLAEQGKS